MLHQSTIRVEFNPNVMRQVDEAKKKYIQAREEGRRITDLNGQSVDLFRAALGGFLIQEKTLDSGDFAFRIFDESGDRRIIWNANDPAQIREAKTLFDQYVTKGWKPYAIARNGRMGRRIRGFDADLQEIVFDEKDNFGDKFKGFAAKVGLKDFAKEHKEVKMMPRTYPG